MGARKQKKKFRPEWVILPGLAVGVFLLSAYTRARPLGAILARMRMRGQDSQGFGYFGASRSGGARKHEGIDFVCTPGEAVYSPVTGTLQRYSDPYGDGRFGGVFIVGDQLSVKMFYLSPLVPVGAKVRRGQQIGTAQQISKKYPGITEHIHLEAYNGNVLVDPTGLIEFAS
jgi:murein DD-endopeptidase MepM/ murein hydrolase activator NlpD